MNKLKQIYASACSATITILVVTFITISAELSVAFKNWLAGFTGHHWVTKSYLSLIVFIVFYLIFLVTKKTVSDRDTKRSLVVLQVFAILGFVAILGFYF